MKADLLRNMIKGTFYILNTFLEAFCVCVCVCVCVCSDTEILDFLTSVAFASLIKELNLVIRSVSVSKNTRMNVETK